MHSRIHDLEKNLATTKGQLALALAVLLSLGFDPQDLIDLFA